MTTDAPASDSLAYREAHHLLTWPNTDYSKAPLLALLRDDLRTLGRALAWANCDTHGRPQAVYRLDPVRVTQILGRGNPPQPARLVGYEVETPPGAPLGARPLRLGPDTVLWLDPDSKDPVDTRLIRWLSGLFHRSGGDRRPTVTASQARAAVGLLDDSDYQQVSAYSCSNGIGVRVLVGLPPGQSLPASMQRLVAERCRELHDSIQEEFILNDPERQARLLTNRQQLLSLFDREVIFAREIPSEYHRRGYPWLLVTTRVGTFKIGWRKRVIAIDWSDTLIRDDAKNLFAEEDVTREGRMIHAWGPDKAREYLGVLLGRLAPQTPPLTTLEG